MFLLSFFCCAESVFAYPSQEILADSGPPFDFDFSASVNAFVLVNDDELFLGGGELIQHIRLADFALSPDQTLELSEDDDTDGTVKALAYHEPSNQLLASQSDGDVLFFDLDDYAEEPFSLTLNSGKLLGNIAVSQSEHIAAVLSSSERRVYLIDVAARALDRTLSLSIPEESSFTLNDIVYNSSTEEFYVSTDAGVVFYFSSDSSQATLITLDVTHAQNLTALAFHPDQTFLYGIDQNNTSIFKINASSHAVIFSGEDLALEENSDLIDLTSMEVKNTEGGGNSGDYLFVAGSAGLSVIDLSNDDILDLGSDGDVDEEPLELSDTYEHLFTSSADDGYLYGILSGSELAIITGNPWITFNSVIYADDAEALEEEGSFTLSFSSDQAGTYEVRANGDVAASGDLLTTSAAEAATGSLAADEDIVLVFNYADNSSYLEEGDNLLYVFVTNSEDERGRLATTVIVDTPPDTVALLSTGFGDESVSVTFTRLEASDIDHYNMYVDTDADEVLTKEEVATEIAQASSGSSISGVATGLNNGTTYYIALEAVDESGNISASRSSMISGAAASAIPQNTGGPLASAGISGSCSLNAQSNSKNFLYIPILTLFFSVLFFIRRSYGFFLIVAFSLCLFTPSAFAADSNYHAWPDAPDKPKKVIPKMLGEMEIKTGLWVPDADNFRDFFGSCCNLWTRLQGGVIFKRRYGVQGSAGFVYKSGQAQGVINGLPSSDRFKLMFVPMELSGVWRADYFDWRGLIPFVKIGGDLVYYRENTEGDVVSGIKYGFHGGGGLQLNLLMFSDSLYESRDEYGLQEAFFVLEAGYHKIDNFGSSNLNLSGPIYSAGFLFEF